MKIDGRRAAISLGALFGILHAAWVLVLAGMGGRMADWWMTAHHMQMTYNVLPLNGVYLIFGTIGAAIIGGAIGGLFAWLWNSFG